MESAPPRGGNFLFGQGIFHFLGVRILMEHSNNPITSKHLVLYFFLVHKSRLLNFFVLRKMLMMRNLAR